MLFLFSIQMELTPVTFGRCLHRKLSELTEKKKKVFQFFKMINVLLINVLVFPTN